MFKNKITKILHKYFICFKFKIFSIDQIMLFLRKNQILGKNLNISK